MTEFYAQALDGPISLVENLACTAETAMILFRCPKCGHGLRAADEMAGKRVKCTRCPATTTVPTPVSNPEIVSSPEPPLARLDAPDESPGRINRFACPACGSRLKVVDEKTGPTVKCPNCRQPVTVPPPVQPQPRLGITLPETRGQLPLLPPRPTGHSASSFWESIEIPVGQGGNLSPTSEVASEQVQEESSGAEHEYQQVGGDANTKALIILSSILIVATLVAAVFIAWSRSDRLRPANKKSIAGKQGQTPTTEGPERQATRPPTTSAGESSGLFDPFSAIMAVMGLWCLFVFVLLMLHILEMIWVVRDARNRSVDNGVMWMVVVFFFPLLGLLVYLASRPAGRLILCTKCNNKRLDYVKTCPHCGRAMQIGGEI
jgi:predicted Zn finger-like uncharacterized protein